MVAKPVRSKTKVKFGWRALAVSVLTIVGIVALTGFMIVHWTERQILTTDNWVKVVGPLPQNEEVSSALSAYTIDKLFTTTNLEDKISQALPDRASFLAPTLTDQLQTRLTNRTKQLIESDQFTNLWTTANKTAHQRLIASARGETASTAKVGAKFNLNLDSIKSSVNSFLTKRNGSSDAASGLVENKSVGVAVNLKTSLESLKSYIRTADFLNGTLGVFAIVCLMGALVISYSRRKLLMTISLTIVTVGLLQLIGVKALRPAILNQIENVSFRPAVGVVYDTLLSSVRNGAAAVVSVGFIIFLVTYFTQTKFVNRSKYLVKQLKQLKKTKFWLWLKQFRVDVRRYIWQVSLGVVLLGLIIMAFFIGSLDWQSVVRSILLIVFSVEIVYMVAARPKDAPMKH